MDLVALGGFAGLASLVAAIGGLVNIKKDTKELKPDHGSSIADAVNRIEKNVDVINGRLVGLEKDLRAERKAREDAERAKQKAEESRIVEDRKKIKKQSNSIPKIISVIVGIMPMIWTVLAFKDIDDFPWWAILLL